MQNTNAIYEMGKDFSKREEERRDNKGMKLQEDDRPAQKK